MKKLLMIVSLMFVGPCTISDTISFDKETVKNRTRWLDLSGHIAYWDVTSVGTTGEWNDW